MTSNFVFNKLVDKWEQVFIKHLNNPDNYNI